MALEATACLMWILDTAELEHSFDHRNDKRFFEGRNATVFFQFGLDRGVIVAAEFDHERDRDDPSRPAIGPDLMALEFKKLVPHEWVLLAVEHRPTPFVPSVPVRAFDRESVTRVTNVVRPGRKGLTFSEHAMVV